MPTPTWQGVDLQDGFHIETHAYKRRAIDIFDRTKNSHHKAILILRRSGFSNKEIGYFFQISPHEISCIYRREVSKYDFLKFRNKPHYLQSQEVEYDKAGNESGY